MSRNRFGAQIAVVSHLNQGAKVNAIVILSELHMEWRRIVSEIEFLERLVEQRGRIHLIGKDGRIEFSAGSRIDDESESF
jgi:hypothetical protein